MFYRDFFVQSAFDMRLRFYDSFVFMQFLSSKNRKFRLAIPVHFNLKNFGTINSSLPVEVFFYQINNQIQKKICAAIGINAVFICNQSVGLQIYFRKLKLSATAQCVEKFFPFSNPDDASIKVPLQILATSAPFLYCFSIQLTKA